MQFTVKSWLSHEKKNASKQFLSQLHHGPQLPTFFKVNDQENDRQKE